MNYEENPNKEKRIAFLSVFSSICRTGQIDMKTAGEVVDELFKKYPLEETKPMQQQTQQGLEPKQKPSKCPNCGSMAYYHNKGISPKSGAPYENRKCAKCKFIKWETMNYEQHRLKDLELKGMREQNEIDVIEEEQFNERQQQVPPEYGGGY